MESIEAFVAGMDLTAFESDDKTRSAVVRKFEIIGEAAKHVPEEICQKYPQVSWKRMASMRDRLIHVYFGVDYPLVWKTIKEDIPATKPLLRKILQEMR